MSSMDWVSRVREYIRNTPGGSVPADPLAADVQGALLANLGAGMQAEIQRFIGRKLSTESYTEAYDGGRSSILLNWDPVISLTSVSIFGQAWTVFDPTTTPYTGPTATSVLINKDLNGIDTSSRWISFPCGRRNVVVTYRAGVTPDDDIYQSTVQAAAMWMAAIYRQRDSLGLTSTTTQGGAQTTYSTKIPDYCKQMLAHCVRVARKC